MGILKVAAHSNATATAGALANTIRQQGEAEIQGIGPKAVNQAVKAIAIARSYLASSGVDLVTLPGFVDVEIDGQPRTAVRFLVKPRHLLQKKEASAEPSAEPLAPREPLSLDDALSGKSFQELTQRLPAEGEQQAPNAH
jgi:stage V sporulation protein S